ncbi:MAG: alginate O-acetyltransferase complex protein AlgI, partial [Bacteroidia bacterium]
AIYFLTPGIKLKNLVLLGLSWFFYAWGEGELVILMLLSSLFNYGIGLLIHRAKNSGIPLFIGVAVNILALVYFKYIGLIVGSIDTLLGTEWNNGIDIHLPIGISFFTFQSISYIVDLHRGQAKVQKNPLDLMLYISLFPQLIAGPIVRYTQVEKNLKNRTHSLHDIVEGLKRFCIGLAKKVLVANVMGELADQVFLMANSELYFALCWVAVLAFAIQVYFDFSGYSDMAIGLGRVFGFQFPENFNYPYICKSVTEFWRRWHITLSTWFRDYLYIPLGGSRKGIGHLYFNLITVFFITGLWHGATWNYVLWGLFHGFLMILERNAFGRFLEKSRLMGHVYALVMIIGSYGIFKVEGLSNAVDFYARMFSFEPISEGLLFTDVLTIKYVVIFIIGVIFCMPVKVVLQKAFSKMGSPLQSLVLGMSNVYYLVLLVLSIMSVASSTYNPFIYFRF